MLSFYWAIRNLGPLGDVKPPSFGCCSIKSAQWFPWEWFWSQFCISFLFSLFRIKFLHSVLAKADLILVYNLSKNYSIYFLLYFKKKAFTPRTWTKFLYFLTAPQLKKQRYKFSMHMSFLRFVLPSLTNSKLIGFLWLQGHLWDAHHHMNWLYFYVIV